MSKVNKSTANPRQQLTREFQEGWLAGLYHGQDVPFANGEPFWPDTERMKIDDDYRQGCNAGLRYAMQDNPVMRPPTEEECTRPTSDD